MQYIEELRREVVRMVTEGAFEAAVRLAEIASGRLSTTLSYFEDGLALARALTDLLAVPACHPDLPDGLRQRCHSAAQAAMRRTWTDSLRKLCPGVQVCAGASEDGRRILNGSVAGTEAISIYQEETNSGKECDASNARAWQLRFECLMAIQRYEGAGRLAQAAQDGVWIARVAWAKGEGRQSVLHALRPSLKASPRALRDLAAELREEDPLAAFLLLACSARQLHEELWVEMQELRECGEVYALSARIDFFFRGCPLNEDLDAPSDTPLLARDPWLLWLVPGTAPEGFLFRTAARAAATLVLGGGEAAAFERLARAEGTPFQVATDEGRALVRSNINL
eukprot:tig00000571_g2161.t1